LPGFVDEPFDRSKSRTPVHHPTFSIDLAAHALHAADLQHYDITRIH
jgi:hypothetical protein